MILLSFSTPAKKKLTEIKKKSPKLFIKIQKQLEILVSNPRHPSLRLHKLKGKMCDSWSISADTDYRIIFYYQKNSASNDEAIVIYMLGTHQEVYQ